MSYIILPISHHFMELRIRMIYVFFSILITFLCCYHFSEQIFYIFAKPLVNITDGEELINSNKSLDYYGGRHFIYTDITEAFLTYIKISFVTSIYLCFPVLACQLWVFLVPGLYNHEKTKLAIFCFLSFFLFSLGGMIAYFFIFPVAWEFFLSFERMNSDVLLNIQLQPKINQYIFLVIKILFLFGVSFQLPLYLIFMTEIQLISPMWFIKKRNISCVLSFIMAALLSPPDVVSQVILVIPILFFYEIAIFTMKLLEQYKKIKKNHLKRGLDSNHFSH